MGLSTHWRDYSNCAMNRATIWRDSGNRATIAPSFFRIAPTAYAISQRATKDNPAIPVWPSLGKGACTVPATGSLNGATAAQLDGQCLMVIKAKECVSR
jgi:hypothetical protein